ncbi:MAG: hypothetical protein D6715_13935, partial [Calditrichaeota bacterium]
MNCTRRKGRPGTRRFSIYGLWLAVGNMFWLLPFWLGPALLPEEEPKEQVTYQDLVPLFKERCVICHNGPFAPRKLQLDSYQHL